MLGGGRGHAMPHPSPPLCSFFVSLSGIVHTDKTGVDIYNKQTKEEERKKKIRGPKENKRILGLRIRDI